MLKVPQALQKKYDQLLMNGSVHPKEYPAYRKWLRFYLDFCKKYEHAYGELNSLGLFVDKLRQKNQNQVQQDQAKQAVKFYYAGLKQPGGSLVDDPEPVVRENHNDFALKQKTNPWAQSIEALKNEIRVRHYSPKTLKSYSLWAEKFRYFIQPVLPEDLTPDDVKAFLTFLAVKKKVSASSQNQAFNALLFFSGMSSRKSLAK